MAATDPALVNLNPGSGWPAITMTADVARLYFQTVGLDAPETCAMLAGKRGDPFHVTDFYPIQPKRDANGFLMQGPGHITPDWQAIKYIRDYVLRPQGKDMLGMWHSHPHDTHPSVSDKEHFSDTLLRLDPTGANWRYFLAPITSFDPRTRQPFARGWVLPRGSGEFVLTELRMPGQQPAPVEKSVGRYSRSRDPFAPQKTASAPPIAGPQPASPVKPAGRYSRSRDPFAPQS